MIATIFSVTKKVSPGCTDGAPYSVMISSRSSPGITTRVRRGMRA